MNILIIKTSSIGDIIHALPVVSLIKQIHAQAKVDWVVEKRCASLVEAYSLIDETIVLDRSRKRSFLRRLREKNYDVVFDLQGNLKSGIITAFAKSSHKVGFSYPFVSECYNLLFTNSKISIPPNKNIREDYEAVIRAHFNFKKNHRPEPIKLNLTDGEKEKIDTLIASLPEKKKRLICHGSAWENKRLALSQWIHLLSQMKDSVFLFPWGNQEEKETSETLHGNFKGDSLVLPSLTLPQLQYLMASVDEVISVDSMALHLAGTTNTKTVGIFGPSSEDKYAPKLAKSIQGSCPYDYRFEKRCPKLRSCKTGACIKNLKTEEILEKSTP